MIREGFSEVGKIVLIQIRNAIIAEDIGTTR